MKRQFTTGVSSKTSLHFITCQQGLTLNLWKKTLRYLPSLWIVEDRIHKRIIYGNVKPKLIADYRGAGLFTLILNRKVEPVNRIVQELCESRGERPGLSVLTSLLVSVDVKNY